MTIRNNKKISYDYAGHQFIKEKFGLNGESRFISVCYHYNVNVIIICKIRDHNMVGIIYLVLCILSLKMFDEVFKAVFR